MEGVAGWGELEWKGRLSGGTYFWTDSKAEELMTRHSILAAEIQSASLQYHPLNMLAKDFFSTRQPACHICSLLVRVRLVMSSVWLLSFSELNMPLNTCNADSLDCFTLGNYGVSTEFWGTINSVPSMLIDKNSYFWIFEELSDS